MKVLFGRATALPEIEQIFLRNVRVLYSCSRERYCFHCVFAQLLIAKRSYNQLVAYHSFKHFLISSFFPFVFPGKRFGRVCALRSARDDS